MTAELIDRLCKDCKHVDATSPILGLWLCERTKTINRRLQPLTGEPRIGTKNLYAFNERDCGWMYAVITGRCGRYGRFWEAREQS